MLLKNEIKKKIISFKRFSLKQMKHFFEMLQSNFKTTFTDSKKKNVKIIRNYVLKCNLYVFVDITKVVDFR